jgi:hypothetical protein
LNAAPNLTLPCGEATLKFGTDNERMERTPNGWTVIDEDAGVLVYKYLFRPGSEATTFATRIADGRLLVVSPAHEIPAAAFDDLLRYGEVRAIVAPNGGHHLGIAEWRQRFPDARCFAPPEAATQIGKKNPAAGDLEPIAGLSEMLGGNVHFREVTATRGGETLVWVKLASGYAWFASDMICNWDSFSGNFLIGWLWKLSKSGPGFKLFNLAIMANMKDKKQALSQFLEDVKAHPPTVLVPSHGAVLSHDGLAEETEQLISAAL